MVDASSDAGDVRRWMAGTSHFAAGIDRHSSLGASAAAEVPTNPGGACGSVRSLKAIPPSCVRHNHFKCPVPPLLEKERQEACIQRALPVTNPVREVDDVEDQGVAPVSSALPEILRAECAAAASALASGRAALPRPDPIHGRGVDVARPRPVSRSRGGRAHAWPRPGQHRSRPGPRRQARPWQRTRPG